MSMGNFLDSLSQRVLAGIILVGRLGVHIQCSRPARWMTIGKTYASVLPLPVSWPLLYEEFTRLARD